MKRPFFGLIGGDSSLVVPLTEAFRAEKDPGVRIFLLEVLWQQRDFAAIRVLAAALNDSDARIWKEALNGLVALPSAESIAALKEARQRAFDSDDEKRQFLVWLEEATDQAEAAMAGNQ